MKVLVHSKKRVFDGFFKIDEAQISYEKFDGQMSPTVHRLNFERGDSVSAIVYNRDTQKVVLVNQFKYPTYEKGPGWITETAAGILRQDETPEAAIRREVLEETGYEIDKLQHISTFYVSPGGSSERIIFYYAEVVDAGKVASGKGVEAENEDIRTLEFSFQELKEDFESGKILDAKTIIGIMWLQRKFEATESSVA